MRKFVAGLLAVSLATGFGGAVSATASAAPAPQAATGAAAVSNPDTVGQLDELPNPAEDKRREMKQQAITGVLNGELHTQEINGSKVVKVGSSETATSTDSSKQKTAGTKKDQYVELEREKSDRIFVILAEFGDERDPAYPDQDTNADIPGPAVFNGPLVNQIPEPDRSVDNSTVWQPDFSQAYYQQTYFGTGPGVESLKTYYETQSSGRYSVDGEVTDWVKVKYNEARYGRSDGFPCATNFCQNTWDLVKDAANQWVADQEAAGRSDADITADLKSFDVWDRYDYDGDGDFNEPDGYIDHFQIVHAGGDQADGDPQQGEDAIWSHRWYAYATDAGLTGPATNELGGTEIGGSGVWIGDYTIQPENGGRSVFFHEFAHDLGLPDDYDTNGGPSNNNEYWTLMSQSRLNAKGEALGERGGDLGAWNKLQLGWLDYEVAVAGQKENFYLGPEEYNTDKAQALVVVLPKKTITTELGEPFEGTQQWWSGQGDNLTSTMSRPVTLAAGTSTLAFKGRWNIETDYDYAYVEVDDGTGWASIPGNITDPEQNNGITGVQSEWADASFDLSAYAGSTVNLRVRYTTDGGVQGDDPSAAAGIFVDAITLTTGGAVALEDGAETSPNGWDLSVFSSIGSATTSDYDNYYIAGYRTYTSYDQYLRTGPYNFGFLDADTVEHFSYQQGLLISYWDTSQTDNNVSAHPGQGLNLYVDSHPKPIYRLDGLPWRNRVQLYDAPFSKKKADSFTLHIAGEPSYIRGQRGNPVFDDTKDYFDPASPGAGVIVADSGIRIKVLAEAKHSATIRLTTS